jgi:hypothetical protein
MILSVASENLKKTNNDPKATSVQNQVNAPDEKKTVWK